MTITRETILEALNIASRIFDALEKNHRVRFVFVGGAAVPLYADTVTFESFAPTKDLDVVTAITSEEDFLRIRRLMRQSDFVPDSEAGMTPPEDTLRFRWWYEKRFKVDILSTRFDVDGNHARWFRAAWKGAFCQTLPGGTRLWLANPAAFVASKLDAYAGRGNGNLLGSKDFAEVLYLMAARSSLVAEIEKADVELRLYVTSTLKSLASNSAFQQSIAAQFHDDNKKAEAVREKLSYLINLAKRLW